MPTISERSPAPAAAAPVFYDFAAAQASFLDALVEGLSAPEKAIPCRFLYDERGSHLFDLICEQPEYYPTRTELGIIERHAPDIAALAGPRAELIELGSGSSRKVRLLLDAMDAPEAYVPVDIAREHLRAAARRVAAERPGLRVHAVCADYTQAFALPETGARGARLAFFPGSTIGNFTRPGAEAFLSAWARRLGPGAAMIVGVDLKKPADVLERAYDDAAGVTAAFSLNLLARANRELGADFELAAFRHRARWAPRRGCVEIHLVSLADQTVHVGGHAFTFAKGEPLHVEDSHKYEIGEFADMARAAGFGWRSAWTDPQGLFSVQVLQAAG